MNSFRKVFFRDFMRGLVGSSSGQAFLIVVLIMVIALTVGLSVASRTVTNLKMGSEEANSQKAFSAAEAGIEQTLQTTGQNPVNQNFNTNNGSQIIALSRTYLGGCNNSVCTNKVLLNNGSPVPKDEGLDIWFTPFSQDPTQIYSTVWPSDGSNGSFTIYWGEYTGMILASPCNYSAIELMVISYTGSSNWRADPSGLRLARYPVESGCTNGRSSGFAVPNAGGVSNFNGQGVNFQYGNSFGVSGNAAYPLNHVIFVRVIPLFYNTKIGVQITTPNLNFPSTGQGQIIISEGQAGSTQRQLTYFETWDTLPSEFIKSVLSSQ